MPKSILYVAVFISSAAFGQSKKELQNEVAQLKSETQALKQQLEELKKPVEVQLTDKHSKASYGLGVLVASNVKSQAGDSLALDILIAGIKDVFTNKSLLMDQQA